MSDEIVEQVRAKYAAAATGSLSGDHAGVRAIAEAFGYSPDELSAVPAEANLGLSCGNPTAFASLKPGETVVDLGCGGGLDVLLAAAKVGPTGRAIGIDRNTGMIRFEKKLPAPLMGSPVIVDGVWLQGDCGGVLHAYDVRNTLVDPPELWSVTLGGCIESTPTVWKGRIYVGTRAGSFFAIGDA